MSKLVTDAVSVKIHTPSHRRHGQVVLRVVVDDAGHQHEGVLHEIR